MNEISLEEIAETEDSGDPVFKASLPNDSYATFLFPDNGYIRVHHVDSQERGDMKKLLNYVTNQFGMEKVEFFNILEENVDIDADKFNEKLRELGVDEEVDEGVSVGGNLSDRLKGFRRIEVEGIVVLRGVWKPDIVQG